MQIKKENIKKELQAVAKLEFIKYGFKDASMRRIAKEAKVGLSNIYNYFKNKDEMFRSLLEPIIAKIDLSFEYHNSAENLNLDAMESVEHREKEVDAFIDFIENYKEELKLLVFKSYGSSLQDYKDQWIDKHTQTSLEYLKMLKKKYPRVNDNVSPLFVHTMGAFIANVICEILMHDASKKEIKKFAVEYYTFSSAGWKSVLGL